MQRRTFVANLAVAFAAASVLPFTAARHLSAHGNPQTHIVDITEFVFSPAVLNVHEGDTIRWINKDIVPHTATAADESWDTGELAPGASGDIKVTADTPTAYFCRFHPSMKAALRIT